jgi:hypothetical protein
MIIATKMSKFSKSETEQHVGIFSRLLLLSLDELMKKNKLRRITINGMHIIKHELRLSKTIPFLIRKIYITPSTFFYEGPYREEKCAVTRRYEEQQDKFLRITFRDEGKLNSATYKCL